MMPNQVDALRHLVFDAMTKPERVKQWWGRLGAGYLQCEISSRASPRVRGPKIPIDSITTSIEAAIKVKTPATPKSRRKKPIRKLVKMALNRLHEYTKPTA